MADTVEKNVEDMLTELEQMKRVKLFNEDEINMILKQRRHYEYLLQKRKKNVKDFQAYINHEVRILALLKLRRSKIGYAFKKDDIEKPIMSRLERLHRLLCHRFPSDLTHWIARIKLLESFGKYNAVNKTWTKCFQLHPTAEPRLWSTCAHWLLHRRPDLETPKKMKSIMKTKKELLRQGKATSKKMKAIMKNRGLTEDMQDLTSAVETEIQQISYRYRLEGFREARIILTRAVQNLAESQELYRELVKLEVLHMDYLKFSFSSGMKKIIDLLDIEEDLSSIESGALLKVVLDEILSKWPNDYSFIESLVEIVDSVPSLIDSPAIVDLHSRHSALVQEQSISKRIPELKDGLDVESKPDNLLLEMHEILNSGDPLAAEKFYKLHQNSKSGKSSYELFSCFINSLIGEFPLLDEDDKKIATLRKKLRHEFHLEIDNWGKKKVDYWLKYINFEENYGDPLNVAELYHRAGKQLPENLFNELNFARCYGDR